MLGWNLLFSIIMYSSFMLIAISADTFCHWQYWAMLIVLVIVDIFSYCQGVKVGRKIMEKL